MDQPRIEVASDAQDLAERMVSLFLRAAEDALSSRGLFFVAISGGRTPERFFRQLAGTERAQTLPWDKVHVFWVDERYVPFDSEASNYRLVAETLLKGIEIPRANVHRIPTEYGDINEAAKAYKGTIREVFRLRKGQMPQFDLLVLGMGSDGHTGSLFPDSYAAYDIEDLACVVYVKDHAKFNRITLTRPVLLAARRLVVLVSGRDKANTLKEVLSGEPDEVKYPIHVLWPALDRVTWLVDREAAAEIGQA